ncbi:MAG: PQQ-binding-like beta-propeller repeat protein, partial [Planctomycetales bacterium]|nr:PQQ-binding-like beta-propeller repeat protein [Planctomycetales bacterium]
MNPEYEAKVDNTEVEAKSTPRMRRRWFPFVWTGLIVGTCVLFQFGEADQDAKNFSLTVGPIVLVLGLSIWFIRSTAFTRPVRWCVGLAPWMAALAFFSAVELINNGNMGFIGWRWRWAAEHDQQLDVPDATTVISDWEETGRDYPRFLGNGFWAQVDGVELDVDWGTKPPRELWRREIGAGWSGFALVGHYAITQEQRGPNELVTCYRLSTGEIIWSHADPVRFDPIGSGAVGGIGPRATPTVYGGRVIAQGATGIVNCLEATTGKVIWAHDTLKENETGNVMWGKACSPLVLKPDERAEIVVVSVGAANGRSLVAYDLENGNEVWAGGDHRSSYASPVAANLAGQLQVLSVNEDYVTGHRASDGSVLWEYPWPGNSDTDATCSQPVPLPDDRVFLSKGYGVGSMILQLEAVEGGFVRVEPVWPGIKRVMKTKMGNVVIRDGFVYGLDGGLMQCIELATGKSQWKRRRSPPIGHGQIILIGDVILVLSETGELLLVEATPEAYRELSTQRVLPAEQITWNNPAFSPPYLLLRNAQEVACYEL